jgi:hypothetical protein
VHRGGRGQSFEYELLFDGVADNVAPHVSGLIEVEARSTPMMSSGRGPTPCSRGSVGPRSVVSRRPVIRSRMSKSPWKTA